MDTTILDWVDALAERAGADRDDVTQVLGAHGIAGPKPVPSRSQLRIEAVHFAGVKNLADDDDPDLRRFVPFCFHRAFITPVTAFVSDGKNDAGKSSTLDILKWGVRGSSNLAGDVKKWLRQVCLLLTISNERVLVAWRVDEGTPRGEILVLPASADPDLAEFSDTSRSVMTEQAAAATDAGEPVFYDDGPVDDLIDRLHRAGAFTFERFDGDDHMAAAVGKFMMQRLGLDALTQWTRVAGATDLDDGNAVEHQWPLWSQALVITKPSTPSPIGETPIQAQNVLSTFLATEWSSTKLAARAQRKAADARLAGIQRRRARDDEAREASAQELHAERARVEHELNALPDSGMTAAQAQEVMDRLTAATANLTSAQRLVAEAALAYGVAGHALEAAQQDLVALKEAAVTKRFWHALKPSCCPRCDAKVQPEQWQREIEGSCSLCNNPIGEDAGTSEGGADGGSDDDLDPVALAEERVAHHAAEEARLSAAHDEAMAQAKAAQEEFEQASEAIQDVHADPRERKVLERRLAILDGRIQERAAAVSPDPEEDTLAMDARILELLEEFAATSAKTDYSEALTAVSAQITTLGKQLGISNLEKATLQGNAHLPVIKGGEKTSFGKLTDGEKLRLKIALVVSLLDVGTTSGLGRHPGLLIIDSLATEELNPANGQLLLRELERVAQSYGLQVITSTAHSEIVTAVLPEAAVQRPTAQDMMW